MLATLPDASVHCCVTSPPYWGLRNYGVAGQIGLEPTIAEYVAKMVAVFAEVRRVLRDDGTCWVNLGDSYATGTQQRSTGRNDTQRITPGGRGGSFRGGSRQQTYQRDGCKSKDLIGIPWRVAFALQDDGWYLRQDIIWAKPNPMPESVTGSHYSRHLVTVKEYERLSGLPYVDERAGDAWAGDMPLLSERESISRKAPLSAERQGHCDSPSKGGAGGRKGKAQTVQPVSIRCTQQSQVRGDSQGPANTEESDREVPQERQRKDSSSYSSSADEGSSKAEGTEGQGEQPLCQNGKRESPISPSTCTAQGSHPGDKQSVDGRRLGGDSKGTQVPLLLLQEEDQANDGSRNPAQQERPAREGERGSGMPALQQQETGPADTPLLVGCPGCPKCIQHHGYTFHLSAGRCTKAHEYVFLLSKRPRYYFDQDAIRTPFSEENKGTSAYESGDTRHRTKAGLVEYATKMRSKVKVPGGWDQGEGAHGTIHRDGRTSATYAEYEAKGANKRSVWNVATEAYAEAHFATFPTALVRPCILAGCPEGGTVLDPFSGSGTTGVVALRHQRNYIGIELNPEYVEMSHKRIKEDAPLFNSSSADDDFLDPHEPDTMKDGHA